MEEHTEIVQLSLFVTSRHRDLFFLGVTTDGNVDAVTDNAVSARSAYLSFHYCGVSSTTCLIFDGRIIASACRLIAAAACSRVRESLTTTSRHAG